MTEEIKTSDGGSVTPTPPQPVTGTTPASGSATHPVAPSLTLEEALKKLADYEHKQNNVTEELERHRKFRANYDKQQAEADAAKKAAEEAQLSEIERVKKQHAETEQQVQRYKQELVNARVTLAASTKGIIDPELAALAIQSALEYDKDGMPMNVDEALDTLIKNKPYLAPKPADPPATATPAQTAQSPRFATPALPAMNPGRTQIAQPGSLPFGKPVRLADIRRNK